VRQLAKIHVKEGERSKERERDGKKRESWCRHRPEREQKRENGKRGHKETVICREKRKVSRTPALILSLPISLLFSSGPFSSPVLLTAMQLLLLRCCRAAAAAAAHFSAKSIKEPASPEEGLICPVNNERGGGRIRKFVHIA